MKIYISCLLLLFTCFIVKAQDRTDLEQRAQKMYTFLVTSQYDSLRQYIPEHITESETREDLINTFKNNDADGLILTLLNTPPNFTIGEIKKIHDTYYSIIYFDQTIQIKLDDYYPQEEINYVTKIIKQRTHSDRAVYNKRLNAILFLTRMKTLAVASKENNFRWWFFAQPETREISEQLGL